MVIKNVNRPVGDEERVVRAVGLPVRLVVLDPLICARFRGVVEIVLRVAPRSKETFETINIPDIHLHTVINKLDLHANTYTSVYS